MRRAMLALLFLGCCVWAVKSPVFAAGEAPVATKAQVLSAIWIFGDAPLSEEGQVAAKLIVNAASDRDDVEIVIDQRLYPWLMDTEPKEKRQALLASLIAGNMRSQLETGISKDDTYSGMLFLFRVYNSIKSTDQAFSIAAIEEQLAAHREGELHQYIARTRAAAKDAERQE